MATVSDVKYGGDVTGKNETKQIEEFIPQPTENALSAWQCIRQNPKITLWAIWANSEYTRPIHWRIKC